MILFYKNSFLASVVSIIGSVMILGGIACFSDGEILPGILLIVLAIPVMILAKWISNNKAFKKWWKQVESANLTSEIAASTETAKAIYQKNPQKRTLEAIRKLNPAAAAAIEGKPLISAPQKTAPQKQAPKAQPQKAASKPAPAPALQSPPRQTSPRPAPQSAPPRPAAARPAAQQAAPRQEAPKPAAPRSAVDAELQQIIQEINGNTQRQSGIYWQNALKLENLHRAHPEHKGITKALAQTHFLFGNSIKDYTYDNRKKAVESLLRSLELQPDATQKQLEQRVHMLYVHAIMASTQAGNSTGTREQMIEAREMLRLCSMYRIQLPIKEGEMMVNVSLPIARCRIAYCLAKHLAHNAPVQPRQAAAMIDEAIRFCPSETMRQSELNPYMADNTTVILTRQELLNLKNEISAMGG